MWFNTKCTFISWNSLKQQEALQKQRFPAKMKNTPWGMNHGFIALKGK